MSKPVGSIWKWWPGETDYPTRVTVIRAVGEDNEVCYSDEYLVADQLVSGEDTWVVADEDLTTEPDEAGFEIPDNTARRNGPIVIGERCPWCGAMVEGPDHTMSHD